jgi:hypothetical protein
MKSLARAIFVVDKTERINYIQLVKEMSSEPDYQTVLDDAKKNTRIVPFLDTLTGYGKG